jgi:hypothetical protein
VLLLGGDAAPAVPEAVEVTDDPQLAAALRRRRAASWRLPPLVCGRHDPLDPGPRAEPDTDAELRSWRLAWAHLADAGYPALIPADVVAAGRRHRCCCPCHATEVPAA